MKSWSTCLRLGVVVMVAGLCSCSMSTEPGNDGENTNANTNGNENENANGNENGNGGADLVVFQDPDSDFSTTDVMDVDAEIVRFDAAKGQIIWAEDGTTEDGWNINGNLLQDGFFTVAFGTENGERGAYFTETATATICNIRVDNGRILISATNTPVPQE